MLYQNLRDARRRGRAGFTLVELIVVLVVLAALAALVIPTLGFVRDQADTALSANGAQQVLNNLEQFKAATGRYPDRLDTLVDETGSFYAPIYTTSAGNPYIGDILNGSGANGNFAYYYMANGGGISEVAVHDSTNISGSSGFDPNAGGTTQSLGSGTNLVMITAGTSASAGFSDKRPSIIRAAFPNQITSTEATVPDGHTLVLLGVGATNSAVGSTMAQAPLAPEKAAYDFDQYDRFIAVFDVTGGGPNFRGQMKLVAVLDPQFNVVARNIRAYKNSTPDDNQGSSVTP